ncbi:MAG: FAD:protein FMN transferase [Pseudomonadota bacterium]
MIWRNHLQWLLLLPGLLLQTAAHSQWLSQEAAIMGTQVRVEHWHEDAVEGKAAIEAVLAEFRRIDRSMSPYREASELSLLNREAAKRPVSVSEELFRLLERSLEISELTNGAFDITFASVGHQYDYRKGIAPTDQKLQQDLPKIDFRHILLNPADHSVTFKQPGVRIDLGGIAKGYAVDQGIKILQQRNITQALITAGGDSRLLGDRGGRPWHIGIRAPRDPQAMVAVLPLVNTAISTSGDYERYFEADGVRHHHIISPATGRSAREVQSVTIIGPDATLTDALSTSLFVMGPAAGLQLINTLPELEAVIIDRNGKMLYSSGLAKQAATPTTR